MIMMRMIITRLLRYRLIAGYLKSLLAINNYYRTQADLKLLLLKCSSLHQVLYFMPLFFFKQITMYSA